MYIQRYMEHLPAAGEIVLFDRSWYNRAGVERVMGFCTDEQYRPFLERCPLVEQHDRQNGIILIKYWLEVSQEQQTERLQERIDDARKIWKLSGMDLESLPPLVRLLASPGRDVRRHRHRVCALVRRQRRRRAPRAAELHQPPALKAPPRGGTARAGEAHQTPAA